MDYIKLGQPNAINPVDPKCEMDEFENHIRKIGVFNACNWFGHYIDSEFTRETIEVLLERTEGSERDLFGRSKSHSE